jgi:hypothetical protein
MKSHLSTLFRCGAALAALAFVTAAARAEDGDATTTRLTFSDTTKPGTLKASLPWADVHVTGIDGDEVIVTSSLGEKGKEEARPDGLRRLDEEVSFELTERDNVATLRIAGDNPWAAHGVEFEIQVPRHTRLVLRTDAGGDTVVENVDGDIEITSMNGEVALRDIGSSAVVSTMNGEISASFKNAPQKPVSLSSMNGEIFVKLPGDTKANIRLRSHNGSILTDFPDTLLKTKSEKSSTGKGYSYSYGSTPEAAREAAQAARDAARETAREIARASREAAQAVRESARALEREEGTLAPVAPLPPTTPLPAIAPLPPFGGKSIVGTLNGGGIDISLATMNGTITLRQTK